jgi:hypothetical protein
VLSSISYLYSGVSSVIVSTIANIASLVIEPVDALVVTGEKFHHGKIGEGFLTLASAPVSPLGAQRAMGNAGFRRIRFFSGAFSLLNPWLTSSVRAYLNAPIEESAQVFKRLTEEWPLPVEDAEPFYAYDASAVYNGHIADLGTVFGSLLNQLNPSAAHGDVRSYDEVAGMAKRLRTFTFIYNFTRARKSRESPR